MRKRLILPSILAISCVALPGIGRSDTPSSPRPAVPSPSASAISCDVPETIGPDDAFGRAIDDPRTLALISYVENLPDRERAAVVRRASTPLPTAITDEIRHAPGAGCTGADAAYGGTRLQYAVELRWSSSDDAIAIGSAARFAVGALLLGDRISKSTRAAALAVFGTSENALDALLTQTQTVPTPSPSATAAASACPDIEAIATKAVPPEYPTVAKAERVTGNVRLTVALDSHGYVRSVNIFDRDAPENNGGDAIVSAATISAGASDYRPQFRNCEPRAGTYIFRADFSAR